MRDGPNRWDKLGRRVSWPALLARSVRGTQKPGKGQIARLVQVGCGIGVLSGLLRATPKGRQR